MGRGGLQIKFAPSSEGIWQTREAGFLLHHAGTSLGTTRNKSSYWGRGARAESHNGKKRETVSYSYSTSMSQTLCLLWVQKEVIPLQRAVQ